MRVFHYHISEENGYVIGSRAIDNRSDNDVDIGDDVLYISRESGGTYVMSHDIDVRIDGTRYYLARCETTGALVSAGSPESSVAASVRLGATFVVFVSSQHTIGAKMIDLGSFVPPPPRRNPSYGVYRISNGALVASYSGVPERAYPLNGKAAIWAHENASKHAIGIKTGTLNPAKIELITEFVSRFHANGNRVSHQALVQLEERLGGM